MRRLLIAIILLFALAAPVTADDSDDAGAAYKRGHYEVAYRLWLQLAEQGNASAQFNLGTMYADGQGVAQDYAEALKWYRRSADQGNTAAQNNLGGMYRFGLGLPKDYVQAHKWYNLAAASSTVIADRDKYVKYRDYVASRMSAAQIEEAQRLAREWKPGSVGSRRDDVTPVVADDQPSGVTDTNLIAAAQETLRQLGYDAGRSDGIVGPKTRAAVRAFQRDNSLPETGEITPELIEKMRTAWYQRS